MARIITRVQMTIPVGQTLRAGVSVYGSTSLQIYSVGGVWYWSLFGAVGSKSSVETTAELLLYQGADADRWELYVGGVMEANGTHTASDEYTVVDVYGPSIGGHGLHADTEIDAHGVTYHWPWESSSELADWFINSGAPVVAGGNVGDTTGAWSLVWLAPQGVEPSCAVCQGADGALWAAVGAHSGAAAEPTVSVYRWQAGKPALPGAWELVGVAATPADLGGVGDLVAWPAGSGGPTVAAQLGATIVQWMEEMPDGKLVIALGRNGARKVGAAAVDPDTWWLVTNVRGGLESPPHWEVRKTGLLGSGKRVAAFSGGLVGELHAHLVESPVGQDVDQARHWYGRAWAGNLVGLEEVALGDAGTPAGICPEMVGGSAERLCDGVIVAAPAGIGSQGAYSRSEAFGVWVDEADAPAGRLYTAVYAAPDYTRAAVGPPAFARSPGGRVDVIWRGYASSGTAVDTTHLWHRTVGEVDGWSELVYAAGAPEHAVCALSEDEVAWSTMRLIVGPDGALNLFVSVWQGDRLEWHRSADGGVTWGIVTTLVW